MRATTTPVSPGAPRRAEPLYAQLGRLGQLANLERWPNLTIARYPSRDHLFRALWLQRLVHERLDRAMDSVLEAVPAEH
jgi:hypothetical protein